MTDRFNLGEFIEALSKRPSDHYVTFNFGGFQPTDVDSYRGYYCDLALGYEEVPFIGGEWRYRKVCELLADLRAANGKTFTGYKGGEYRMDMDSRLWVANYSHSSGTTIVGIYDCEHATVLLTGYED